MTIGPEIYCPSTGGHEEAKESWIKNSSCPATVHVDDCITGKEAGFLHKLQRGYERTSHSLIAYFHSDFLIHETGWDERVLKEFEDESVGIVGFGGGKRLGSPGIYKLPYKLQQLARFDFVSNLTNAPQHGRRNRNEEDIAVVDSFALIIRRSLLAKVGGWPVTTYPSMHMSDAWACLMARRYGMRVRMIGISCTHKSGGVKGDGSFDYGKWQQEMGMTDSEMHAKAHRLIANDFRDILPVIVP